jgi:hypothetical protein
MKVSGWRGWSLALAGAVAVGLSAACGSSSGLAPLGRIRAAGAGLGSGLVGSRSAVPWRRVGAGWVLAEYWPGRRAGVAKPVAAAVTLYLIDPAGGRYQLYRWPVTASPPELIDWSGDKARALLGSGGALEQLRLATGKVSHLRLPGKAQVIGYTHPNGNSLLGWRQTRSHVQLAQYQLTGQLAGILASGLPGIAAVYSATGAMLAAQGQAGIRLVSTDGGVIRTLTVPDASDGCFPSRWWSPAIILASCQATAHSHERLWLVPADGAEPTPLTRSPGPNVFGAWRVPGSLYVQTLDSSGEGRILRQAPDGSLTPVTVPGTAGNNLVVQAVGARLLVSAHSPCFGSGSLLWFTPSTHQEQTLISPPSGMAGVIGVVPYGPPTATIFTVAGCSGSG